MTFSWQATTGKRDRQGYEIKRDRCKRRRVTIEPFFYSRVNLNLKDHQHNICAPTQESH